MRSVNAGMKTRAGRDIAYAIRVLTRERGFSITVILTMALAIGVTATLFSVLDAVLLRPLPWPDSDRLVRLSETHVGATRDVGLSITTSAYAALSDTLTTADGLAAWSRSNAILTSAASTARVAGALVTPGTFAVLRAVPLAGRLFQTDDEPSVILSYGLWATTFGRAQDIVGRPLTLDGQTLTIVGVMPPQFAFPDRDVRLWRPLRVPKPPAVTTIGVIARLRDRVTPRQMSDEATALARTVRAPTNALLAWFGSDGPITINAEPALEALTHDVRPGLIAVFFAAGLLFVAAIANLAGLQLVRATTRVREIAVRTALGATTGRLLQQLIVEQLLLTVSGAALGLFLTAKLHRALPSILPADFPRLTEILFRSPIVFLALAIASVSAIALGVIPVFQARRRRIVESMSDGTAASIGGRSGAARAAIVSLQIAVSVLLLTTSLLISRSFVAMMSQDRGFDSGHLLTARLSLPDFAFAPARRIEAAEDFVARVRAIPGTMAVAVTTGLPLSGSENITGFDMPSVRPPRGTSIHVHAVRSVVTPEFARALGLRLLAGRDFRPDEDSPVAPRVVLVNRTFARQYLTESAVGDHLRNFMTGDDVGFEVIGVVDDFQRNGLTDRVQPEIYSLLRQSPKPSVNQDVVIRSATATGIGAEPLRAIVRGIDPQASLDSIRTMDDRIAGSLARPRLYAVLLVVFAACALLLVGVGLVGMLSYTVAQRAREIALRMALGASPSRILRLVLVQGVAATVSGVTLGLTAAVLAAQSLRSLVYGISQHDPVSFIAAPLALAALMLAASVAPALRAVRINPVSTLRG